jgi:predicted P-loop ATPase
MGEVIKMEKTVNDTTLKLDKNGIPVSNSIYNVKTLLLNADVFADNLAFNEFTQEPEVINDFYLNGTLIPKGSIKPSFEDILSEYFETELDVVFKPTAITGALNIFWDTKKYNPVKDYMEQALEAWDGKERLKTVFNYWLGAEINETTETIAKVFFVSAVAKVYEPLTKVDTVLDLVGGQGVGKTSFLSKIARDWYTSNAVSFTDKDSYNVMLKALIVNDDEMTASKRMNFEETKSFISKTVLEFRKSYDRRGASYAKNFVIARTTNNIEYLKDNTGDRRFMPILVNPDGQKKHPMQMTEEDIIQIWGEAVSLYKNGYDLDSFDKLDTKRVEYQENFKYIDPMVEEINRYLDLLLPENFSELNITQQRQLAQSQLNGYKYQLVEDGTYELTTKQDFVTLKQIAYNVFNKDTTDKRMIARIKIWMDNNPYFKNTRKKIGNSYVRGYKRVEK